MEKERLFIFSTAAQLNMNITRLLLYDNGLTASLQCERCTGILYKGAMLRGTARKGLKALILTQGPQNMHKEFWCLRRMLVKNFGINREYA
jgi:hypothetical protein